MDRWTDRWKRLGCATLWVLALGCDEGSTAGKDASARREAGSGSGDDAWAMGRTDARAEGDLAAHGRDLPPEADADVDASVSDDGRGDAREDATAASSRDSGIVEAAAHDAVATGVDGGDCPYSGHITYTLVKTANPTAAEQRAYGLITEAMGKAVFYYNCYADITKALRVTYNPGVATADGNINGSIRFGGTAYMRFDTTMHEISHTLGVGTAWNWFSFLAAPDGGSSGLWKGEHGNAELRAITGNPAVTLKGDRQHFWPYGLNYPGEIKSDADANAHCRIVAAIRRDLGL